MKKLNISLLIVLLLAPILISAQSKNTIGLYAGTFTGKGSEGLYFCSFDTITGEIAVKSVFKALDNPNYLAKSEGGDFLYVCLRPGLPDKSGSGEVASFSIDRKTGKLSFLNKQFSEGADPCYISIGKDRKTVAVSNYGSGNLSVFKINGDGSLSGPVQVIGHTGNGPVKGRQDGPHAHSIRFSPFDNRVFAADLGTDKLMVYNLDPVSGKLVENLPPSANLNPGSGPRHFEFHPNGKNIYVVNELSSTVTVFEEKNGGFDLAQDICTIPEGFSGKNYCADIHLSPNAKYLYCSNRGHNSITIFSVEPDGKLVFKTTVPVQGDWPRNFTFSPSGKFMLVANQNSGNIVVFKTDTRTGIPQFTGKECKVPAPVCLVF